MSQTVAGLDELAALERFVVDNDELLELEERIGKFNIFDALGVVRAEIRHSNFLAWLLDPNESHGQGALFLKAVLMDLLKGAPPEARPLSPVELDGEELRGVEVRREWRRIDLLITCKEPPFAVAVENKIDSGESDGQLGRYKRVMREQFPGLKQMFVFLTTDGVEPSDEDWVPYSYADVHRVLERVRRTGHGAIGDDVEAFLEHYLRLIGSRFMDDPKIDELCQRIYTNHRQALDLIIERVGSQEAAIVAELLRVLESDSKKWHVFNRTSRRIEFVPRSWTDWIPRVSARSRSHPQMWIWWWVSCRAKRLSLRFEIGPASDSELRRRVIERLTRSASEFGLRVTGKHTEKYTRLRRTTFARWSSDDDPDVERLTRNFQKQLDVFLQELSGVPDALRPIIEEWEQKRGEGEKVGAGS